MRDRTTSPNRQPRFQQSYRRTPLTGAVLFPITPDRRQHRHVVGLLKRFPDLDFELLKQRYPDVDLDRVRRDKRVQGNHEDRLSI